MGRAVLGVDYSVEQRLVGLDTRSLVVYIVPSPPSQRT